MFASSRVNGPKQDGRRSGSPRERAGHPRVDVRGNVAKRCVGAVGARSRILHGPGRHGRRARCAATDGRLALSEAVP